MGPIVRIGPEVVSVLTPDILSDLEQWDCEAQITKSKFLEGLEVIMTSDTLTERTAEAKIVSKIQLLTDIFGGKVSASKADSEPSRGFDVANWMSFLAWDIMGDLSFGAELNLLLSKENRQMTEHARRSTHFGGLQGHSRYINWSFLTYFTFPSGFITRIKFLLSCRRLSTARWDRTVSGTTDFFERALNARDPETGEKYSKGQLIMEALLLILAGADTTASQSTACLFYLAKNPTTTSLLAKELHARFDLVDDIVPGSRLSSCPLLHAVIVENMRMAPAGAQWRREVIDPAGVTLSDGVTHFPQGIDVMYPIFCALRDPVNYPDPLLWKPSRWIVSEDRKNENQVAQAKKAFSNFSFGTRRCLGINLAYMEFYLIIARIAWLYEFETMDSLGEKPGKSNEYALKHQIVLVSEGPNLRFWPRTKGV